MRDLEKDLIWVERDQDRYDLSDEWLIKEKTIDSRENYQERLAEWLYGITFVESTIAREWLERAIKAESLLAKRSV
jgi:hypothetical protein